MDMDDRSALAKLVSGLMFFGHVIGPAQAAGMALIITGTLGVKPGWRPFPPLRSTLGVKP